MKSNLDYTGFHFKNQTGFYKGKVRDVYWAIDKIILIASDRISAFDHVLPQTIPFKGQVLNQISAFFLRQTKHIAPNWFETSPDPNVSVGISCIPIRLEMVVRGYLTGHAWRVYQTGERMICGVRMPDGMKENDPFPYPIITPALKADEGHDEDISREEILSKGILPESDYRLLEKYSLDLFAFGTQKARERGLILVDTKYEFGKSGDQIMLIDEVHTPDSSRYFYLDGYQERQDRGEKQKQLSKEFVREWLIAEGFQGKEGQRVPDLSGEMVQQITDRYIHLYELITGENFDRVFSENILDRVEKNVQKYLDTVSVL
ncbi:MAG TPA: phosphoribosylaminoimidazolesuccinocarboxamide synthase [Saprospirales bacterium]|nr:phosphoribosylaminoimidazolesuccinocarboxamide synthase [Saprospirales bacterium]HAY71404.1 phosphoribosylaminoimidazolesuccinocarboxamide synthase [Saprospirales bacterium]HRQ30399.1 phosphoribosylaminoimidazolesuccinocarboxamide synthase [Saprospiraceae bacterium]